MDVSLLHDENIISLNVAVKIFEQAVCFNINCEGSLPRADQNHIINDYISKHF